jgi:hypothetical protein
MAAAYNKDAQEFLTMLLRASEGKRTSIIFPAALELALECLRSLNTAELRASYKKVLATFLETADGIN